MYVSHHICRNSDYNMSTELNHILIKIKYINGTVGTVKYEGNKIYLDKIDVIIGQIHKLKVKIVNQMQLWLEKNSVHIIRFIYDDEYPCEVRVRYTDETVGHITIDGIVKFNNIKTEKDLLNVLMDFIGELKIWCETNSASEIRFELL